jgi:hypothetical protein
MTSRLQIHLSGMVVSRLNRKANSIFTESPLSRKAKSDMTDRARILQAKLSRHASSLPPHAKPVNQKSIITRN